MIGVDGLEIHVHRWRIAEPEGPTSTGRCTLCGAERLFKNLPGEFPFTSLRRSVPQGAQPGASKMGTAVAERVSCEQ